MTGALPNMGGVRLTSRRRVAVAALGLLALALLLAACGGSSGGVAHLGKTKKVKINVATPSLSPQSAAVQTDAIKFATCMREHGVSNFPDPADHGSTGATVDPNSPAVKAAVQDCKSLIPALSSAARLAFQSPKVQSELLSLAACMRSHGVPSFPDPTYVNGLPHFPGLKASDLHSQTFIAALQACKSRLPGASSGF
jgi:hypothetical protein